MRIGILFGGASREREISYAGGRTVYDLLDRRHFEPIPIFLDAFHRFVRLSPQCLYYGMLSDFFPLAELFPAGIRFPLYAEQIEYPESSRYLQALTRLGPILPVEALSEAIDIAFLVLHGLGGEDGSVQGLLEQVGLPYTGVGVWGSAWGMDKAAQRGWLAGQGFAVPRYTTFSRALLWEQPEQIAEKIGDEVGFPCVLKHPLQGSTIGVAVCRSPEEVLPQAYRCAFTWPAAWLPDRPTAKLLDLTQGLGLPLLYRDREGTARQLITDWAELVHFLQKRPRQGYVEAWDSPPYLLAEAFVAGEEFSVIVLQTPSGAHVALPPTHIRKADTLYDYRAKYLSGTSSKSTPSEALPNAEIQREAERLAERAQLAVYARIDGIVDKEGTVFFNDPNTTSGMLPASLLFHQAAEVGFSPRDFLSYVIERSLEQTRTGPMRGFLRRHRLMLGRVPETSLEPRKTIAVIFGGPSTERHISLESGRNVVEKLSARYQVLPLFLEQVGESLQLWELPPRLLFKDNADDVARALRAASPPAVTLSTRQRLSELAGKYPLHAAYAARPISWERLPEEVDFIFLALHGRPGEDGTVQRHLEELGLAYNGSGPEACALVMDKAATQAYLAERGFLVPRHYRAQRATWQQDAQALLDAIEAACGPYPLIGKPVDEGCSSGVVVLPDRETLALYLQAIFRAEEELSSALREKLSLAPDAPFPAKEEALFETYLHGPEWVEVTVGVITHTEGGQVRYQAFLPSETVKGTSILRLEEKFLAGAGQNVTPARLYPGDPEANAAALAEIQRTVEAIAQAVGIHGYGRIDGFVRLRGGGQVEFWTIEINALPGLTPATVFFHQAMLAGYTPLAVLEHIIAEGQKRARMRLAAV